MFLIRNVTPAVATSYAYVNPVVAVLLGTGFGGESLSLIEWLALAVIIFAVVLVTLGKYLSRFAARLLLVRRRNKRQFADPAYRSARRVRRRRSTFQTFGERLIIQLQATAQGALPRR